MAGGRVATLVLVAPCLRLGTAVVADGGHGTCSSDQPCAEQAAFANEGSYYWPQQKGDIGRTGFGTFEVPRISKGPAWTWPDPYNDVIRATPLIDADRNIYLTTTGGGVLKFSPEGKVLWQLRLPCPLLHVPSLLDGRMFVVSKWGRLIALDMTTGEELWNVSVSKAERVAGDTASILALNGIVVFGTIMGDTVHWTGNNDAVMAVSAVDGSFKWTFFPDTFVYNFQGSSTGDGTIVFQDCSGGIYRLSLDDGALIWRSGKQGNGSFTTGATVLFEGRVYVVSNQGSPGGLAGAQSLDNWLHDQAGLLHVYSYGDGRLLWEQDVRLHANQAVTAGRPRGGGRPFVALGVGANPRLPPAVRWSQWGAPQIVVFFIHMLSLAFPKWFSREEDQAMMAFDAETGEPLWFLDLGKYNWPAVMGDQERLWDRFAGTQNGSYPRNDFVCLPDSCSQPVMGPDGTVYQGWQDGKVYAVKDFDGNGVIDPETEVSSWDFGDGFQGSLALAPGILAVAPCGGGLYVFTH